MRGFEQAFGIVECDTLGGHIVHLGTILQPLGLKTSRGVLKTTARSVAFAQLL